MSGRSVEHATFVVERKYEASPERAFAAWADPKAKARWFVGSDARLELDFRVGGREHSQGSALDGRAYSYEALYQDIVPARRAEGMGSLLDALDKELQSAAPGA